MAAPHPASPRPSPLSPRLPRGPGDRVRWAGLHGSAIGLAVSRAAASRTGPVLVLAPDAAAADRLEEDLRFFLAGEADRLERPLANMVELEGKVTEAEGPVHDRLLPFADLRAQRRDGPLSREGEERKRVVPGKYQAVSLVGDHVVADHPPLHQAPEAKKSLRLREPC